MQSSQLESDSTNLTTEKLPSIIPGVRIATLTRIIQVSPFAAKRTRISTQGKPLVSPETVRKSNGNLYVGIMGDKDR